jgi:hypothetical protein
MRKIIATILTILGMTNASANASVSAEDTVSAGLRSLILNLSASEIGLDNISFRQPVWGIVMETGMDGGFYTLVVLADGTTSIYFSNGGGIIGSGQDKEVRKQSEQFLDWANRLIDSSASDSSISAPANGQTKFFFLTFDGRRVYEAAEDDLGEQRDALSPLFHAGHAVIAAARAADK